MSFVLVYGSVDFEPIWETFAAAISGGEIDWLRILRTKDRLSLEYEEVGGSIHEVKEDLLDNGLCSVQLLQSRPERLLASLYGPSFYEEASRQWRCILEGSESRVVTLYEKCKVAAGLTFASISIDEQPELGGEPLTENSFPWDDWRLIRAAVRSTDGGWEERDGSASRD